MEPWYLRHRDRLPWPLFPIVRWFWWRWFWGQESEKLRKERPGVLSSDILLWNSERALFVEAVADFAPFSSILEVGCGFGQNAHIIAPLFPGCRYVGIDMSEERVTAGMEVLQSQGILNVELIPGRAELLRQIEGSSADLVVSSACLLYVPPAKIEEVLGEMWRISRRAVVLLELHETDPKNPEQHLGRFFPPGEADVSGYYVRDYLPILRVLQPEARITVKRVTNPLWPTEQWKTLGTVLVAERKRSRDSVKPKPSSEVKSTTGE